MSYSIGARAATKEAVKAALREKFAQQVVAAQACHQRDQAQALAAADAFIDLVEDDDTKDIVVNMNGSLTGQWSGSDVTRIEGAAVSVSAHLAPREGAAA